MSDAELGGGLIARDRSFSSALPMMVSTSPARRQSMVLSELADPERSFGPPRRRLVSDVVREPLAEDLVGDDARVYTSLRVSTASHCPVACSGLMWAACRRPSCVWTDAVWRSWSVALAMPKSRIFGCAPVVRPNRRDCACPARRWVRRRRLRRGYSPVSGRGG